MAHLLFERDLPCRPVMVGWRWGAQEKSDGGVVRGDAPRVRVRRRNDCAVTGAALAVQKEDVVNHRLTFPLKQFPSLIAHPNRAKCYSVMPARWI